jgi:predicted permease
LPKAVLSLTTLLGGAASPCALVATGLFLVQAPAVGNGKTLCRLLTLKLLVQPTITWVLAFWVFKMPLLWSQTALILSALPAGAGAFLAAKLYDRQVATISRAILYSTLISMVTLSALVTWVMPR